MAYSDAMTTNYLVILKWLFTQKWKFCHHLRYCKYLILFSTEKKSFNASFMLVYSFYFILNFFFFFLTKNSVHYFFVNENGNGVVINHRPQGHMSNNTKVWNGCSASILFNLCHRDTPLFVVSLFHAQEALFLPPI